jgi:hypothetical protein
VSDNQTQRSNQSSDLNGSEQSQESKGDELKSYNSKNNKMKEFRNKMNDKLKKRKKVNSKGGDNDEISVKTSNGIDRP